MKKNDIITLEITDISVDGFGIGRYENIAVFVPFAAVGDTLRVLIVKVLKNYCFGKIVEFIDKSTARIDLTVMCFQNAEAVVTAIFHMKKKCASSISVLQMQ